MIRVILWRLAALVPILLGVSIVSFLLVYIMPGDPLNNLLGPQATQEERDEFAERMGFDQPLPIQFLNWLWQVLQGNLGRSIAMSMPVAAVVEEGLANTLLLALCAAVFGVLMGSILGTVAAAYRGGAVDRVISTLVLTGLSIPNYWFGMILIAVFGVALRVFPVSGTGSGGFADTASHLVLPTLAVSIPVIGMVTRMVRTQVIDNLYSDHVDFLRSNGMSTPRLYAQVWRNTVPGVVTIFGLELGHLLGGAALVEIVFSWPGIGQVVYHAVTQKDIPVIQASLLVVGAFYVVVNLIVDLGQFILDPRLRQEATA